MIATLDKWYPTYLKEMELQLGQPMGMIPEPRSYSTRNNYESFPEDQLPMCIVVSPGLSGRPLREGDGMYRAPWRVGVGVVVSANDYQTTRELGLLYAAATRAIIVQHASLGGFAAHTSWDDESYDDEPIPEADRSVMSVYNLFTVEVEDVVTAYAGPDAPDDYPPGGQWPIAEVVIIDINERRVQRGEHP